jgi:putative PIN family toxin of toxin-antitoxin system
MKAVLDVGRYVSATINAKGHPAQILSPWREDRFELYTSQPILDDLKRVLGYPRIRKRHQWTDEEIDNFADSLAVAANLTPGELQIDAVAQDPTDNKIIACAVEGQVDYVVASDEHLVSLDNFQGIHVGTPRRFLAILEEKH